jgi:UDP-N-acetylglucosamine acyltransferase
MLIALQEAYLRLFQSKMPLQEAIDDLEAHDFLTLEVVYLLKFLEAQHEGRHGRSRDPRAIK